MRIAFTLALGAVAVSPSHAQAALRIIANGRSAYRIVVDRDAVEGPRLAAAELAGFLEKATGVRIPVEEVAAARLSSPKSVDLPSDSPLIVIGRNPWTRKHGISLRDARPESFVIRTLGRNLVIAGHDTAGDPLDSNYRAKSGTLIGVYAFLRDHLDMRWYMPGRLWEVVPSRRGVVIPRIDRLEQPDFVRRDANRYQRMEDEEKREHVLWARRNGGGMGIVGYAKHSWREHLRDVKFEEHPDWFALVGGKRRPMTGGGSRGRGQLCSSNPEVIRHVIQSVRDFYEAHPEYDVCSISPNDGRGFCECERCRALDVPGSDSLTDRIFTFYAAVAEEVARTHPDRYLGCYAYSSYNALPRRIDSLPGDIILTHVQNRTRMRSPEGDAHGLEQIATWGEFHPRIGFYTFPGGPGYWGLPIPNPKWVRRLLPRLKRHGFLGIKLAVLNYVGMQPDLHLYMRLLWDADQDVDRLLEEYYATLFASAAEPIRRYHEAVAASWDRAVRIPGFTNPWRARDRHRALLEVFEPVLAECRALLDEALTKAPDEVVRQRCQVLSDNFHLAELLVEGTRVSGYHGENPAVKIPPERARRMIEIAKEFNAFVESRKGSHAVNVHVIQRGGRGVNIMDVARWEKMLPGR